MIIQFLFFFISIFRCHEVAGIKNLKAVKYGGDTCDCEDLYNQRSMDHPMPKNNSFHPQKRPSYHSRSPEGTTPTKRTKLKREGFQLATVLIRRIAHGASKTESFVSVNEPSGTYDAGVRTKSGSRRYSGGGMILAVYNPRTKPGAYSQARIKISNGPDSIQVGWRVDPLRRGDNLTRIFIYTKTSSSHCFDANCGFVIVDTSFFIDSYFIPPVSQPGGPIYEYKFYIIRDALSGNWWLQCGFDDIKVGYWAKNIFTGLRDLATNVDWAGEVYSPPGVFEPLMGSGYRPSVGTTKYVAYMRQMKVLDENSTYVDADNVEDFATDRSLYDVRDEGNVGGIWQHLILYGGARY